MYKNKLKMDSRPKVQTHVIQGSTVVAQQRILPTDSGRAHAKEYFPELLLPLSFSHGEPQDTLQH